jgi:HPt (histidine-containing phosphotransfer) domain-containing protein
MQMNTWKTRKSDRLDIRLDPQTADVIRQLAERDHRGNISQAARALLSKAANLEVTALQRSAQPVC